MLGLAACGTSLLAVPAAEAQGAHFTSQFTCKGVTITLEGFPDEVGNTVTEIVQVDRHETLTRTFSFDGPTGSNTIAFQLPPGHHQLDARVKWPKALGSGGHDHLLAHGINCVAEPSFTIEKLQAAGRRGVFTKDLVFGTRRETVHYEVVVENTGNVPLSLGQLQDARCDAGTIAGGPGAGVALAAGESTVFTCSHVLTPGDQAFGSYENVATITADPAGGGEGPGPITESSAPVLVQLPHDVAGFGCEAMTFSYSDFPDAPGNTVTEYVLVDHVVLVMKTFVFDGPSATDTVPLDLAPGYHRLDGRAHWKTNGAHGAHDQAMKGKLLCPALPEAVAR